MNLSISTLPAVLRGPAEVQVFLKLPEQFISRWEKGSDVIPKMPCWMTGGTKIYYTEAVVAWLNKYFQGANPEAVVERLKTHAR
jgi:hypothetical protein